MPTLFVWGIPSRYPQEKLHMLIKELQSATASVPELSIKPEQVSVFFPADRCSIDLGQEIITYIDLYAKPERTPKVLENLRINCQEIIHQYFRTALLVTTTILTSPVDVSVVPKKQVDTDANLPSCSICGSGRIKKRDGHMVNECVNCGDHGLSNL